MRLEDIVERLALRPQGSYDPKRQVKAGYVGDLLSDVMAHATEDSLWVTMQSHQNIVAVAVLVGVAGIVITGDREIRPETLEVAEREGVPMFGSPMRSFEVCGRLFQCLEEHAG